MKRFLHKDDLVVREYQTSDLKDIVSAGYPFGVAEFSIFYRDVKYRLFNTLGQLETRRLVLYSKRNRETVGVVTLKKITAALWGIWGIFISPSYRGHGLSIPFYRAAFSYLKNKGVKKAVGAVEVNNLPSRKTVEQTWDRFLSQKYFEYHGVLSRVPNKSEDRLQIKPYHSSDRDTLYELFVKCVHSDWRSFLEIDKSNFLQRIIPGASFPSGALKLLSKNQVLIAEGSNGEAKGYVVIPSHRFRTSRFAVSAYFFVSPELLPHQTMVFFEKFSGFLFIKGFRKYSLFSLNVNEKLLEDFSEMLRANFGSKVFQNMVCVKTLNQ